MRFRGKNSLPLTPKTVHLLRLPRTIGKRKGDDNKFFSPYFTGKSSMPCGHIAYGISRNRLSMGCVLPEKATGFSFRRLNVERLVPGLAVAWIENNSPSQNQPSHNSNPVPNCLTAQKRGRFDSGVKRGCVQSSERIPRLLRGNAPRTVAADVKRL